MFCFVCLFVFRFVCLSAICLFVCLFVFKFVCFSNASFLTFCSEKNIFLRQFDLYQNFLIERKSVMKEKKNHVSAYDKHNEFMIDNLI